MMLLNCNEYSTTTGVVPQLFASALNFFAASQCFLPDNLYQNYVQGEEVYDFIIVGAGSAGSVVANRLSEIHQWRILLLEAGSEPPIESDIPQMDQVLLQSKYDWGYYTMNDGVKHQAFKTGSVYWPRAKMLGGCSSINAMIYVRGRDTDFQKWSDAGNPSWTPENVNFYFRKAESFQNKESLDDSDIRQRYGLDGPLVINYFNSTYREATDKVLESWDSMGFSNVKDINSAKFEGLGLSGILAATAANGRRYSTYRSYLEIIKERNNLKIVKNAFVTKILINDKKEAYGVEVEILGYKKRIYANLDVIISAGSINTPQLLMLSGIGPKEHLLSKNILEIENLPAVGKNLHDHNNIFLPIYGDEPKPISQSDQQFEVIKYMFNRTGLLAQGRLSDVLAFFSRNHNMSYPEFQSHLIMIFKNSSAGNHQSFFDSFHEYIKNSFLEFNTHKHLYLFPLHLLHPYSRGSIYLKSSNPYEHPIIDANYYGDYRDVEATVTGIKILTEIVKTPYFRSINAFVHRVNIPQCNHHEFESYLYWECYVIHTSATVYHPVGTAKMGSNPVDSVVDNNLKVHGVKRLRVIDASIMPYVTSGNTNAPTIMIGEMGSDMIKSEYLSNYDLPLFRNNV